MKNTQVDASLQHEFENNDGIALIASSSNIEVSHEVKGDRNSLFTKWFCEGLTTGNADINNDGFITVDEAFNYAYNLVKSTGMQNPLKYNIKSHGEIVISKNKHFVKLVPLNPREVSNHNFLVYFLLQAIKSTILLDEEQGYFIGLNGYVLDEIVPAHASGLTVYNHSTPNFTITQTGFECDAFFDILMLNDYLVKDKEIIDGRAKVRLRVEYEDIWHIVSQREFDGEMTEFTIFQKFDNLMNTNQFINVAKENNEKINPQDAE